jgi:hypothetical protein
MSLIRRSAALAVAMSFIPTWAAAQRAVQGRVLTSDSLPPVVMELAPGLTYLGTQSFLLYAVARAEQHFFGELDGTRLKRLVWIQFEGYLPDNSHTYDYSEYPTAEIGGRPFHQNAAALRVPETERRPDSDGARARAFLHERGYTMGPEILLQRMVWLIDQPARHEVMLIYMEDLADHGLAAADLQPGGGAADRWPAVRDSLLDRAARVMRLRDR